MKKKAFLISAASVCLCAALTGCGTSKIELNKYLDFSSSGYDGMGIASCTFDGEQMISDNSEAFGKEGKLSEADLLKIEIALSDAIDGELDKNNELSNGDKITYKWDMSNLEAIEEKYSVKFVYSDASYDISDLKEAEEYDPFGDLIVNFSGLSPNGVLEMSVSGGISSNSVRFMPDKTDGLRNGDKIKITADFYNGVEAFCNQTGKIPSVTEKEYTVDGLGSYASKLEDISEDLLEKMKKQTEDSIKASCASWAEGNSFKSAEFIGCYFLSGKEGFQVNPNNELYCVFKVTGTLKGFKQGGEAEETGEDSYYTYCHFTNIMNLPDGTGSVDLSSADLCRDRCDSIFGKKYFSSFSAYTFDGYKDLDSMFNKCVTKKIDKYNYENTVK